MAISQPGYCGAPTGAYLLNGNGLEVATDASPNFTGPTMDATSPLPAAFPLFATGLGAIVLLGWRRKRANTSAFAA
jgi:hypothetical protein